MSEHPKRTWREGSGRLLAQCGGRLEQTRHFGCRVQLIGLFQACFEVSIRLDWIGWGYFCRDVMGIHVPNDLHPIQGVLGEQANVPESG